VSVLVIAQSISEFPEGLMNNPVFHVLLYLLILHQEISLKIKMNIPYFTPMRLNTFKCALKYIFHNLFWTFLVQRSPCKVPVGFFFVHVLF
jgi:hypothetical protein